MLQLDRCKEIVTVDYDTGTIAERASASPERLKRHFATMPYVKRYVISGPGAPSASDI